MANDLHDLLSAAAGRTPRRPALSFRAGDATAFTLDHSSLFAAAEGAALALRRRGVAPGDRVAFVASPSPGFVIAALGALRAGAMLVPINTAYRRREITGILEDAAPRLLLVGEAEAGVAGELASDPAAASIESLGLSELVERRPERGNGGPDARGERPPPELGPADPALMLYTSGTTGKSKGAELTHGNVVAMIESLREAWEWSASDRLLLTLPLFHLHGLVVGLFTALAAGAEVLLEPRFDAARAVDRLAAGEATLFFGVPTLYVRLVEELERRRATGSPTDLSRVRLFVSGSAPLAPETFAAFERLTGQRILERYGMSETGMLLSNPLHGRRIAGSVGTPLPGVEARLVDPEGRPVPAGVEGEIEVRGPSVFRGYRNAPEKTVEAFRRDPGAAASERGWFRTGDLARVDPESGHFFLLGRASELILSGGFNVYPREIEEILLAFPGVREAAVVGEKHPEFGESPVAFVVTAGALDESALAAHCRSELAAFKLPRRFVRVDSLPRNSMGKVQKRQLI